MEYNLVYYGFLVLLLLIFLYNYNVQLRLKNRRNQEHRVKPTPPGPKNMPVLGFIPHLMFGGKHYKQKLLSIKQHYGPVATVQMGSFKCIWLNDYRVIKSAFADPVFCGRPKIQSIISRSDGQVGGLIFNDGADFKEQRRFTLKHLKDLGLRSKDSMESFILVEVKELLQNLKNKMASNESLLISTRHLFNVPVMNILWRIVTGQKFPHDDPTMIQLSETLIRNLELSGGTKVALWLPWIHSLPSSISGILGWKSYLDDARYVFRFWENYVKSKVNAYCSILPPEHFIDHYVKAIKECDDPTSGFYGYRGENSLATIIQDIFIAGTETTSTTLTWALLYLAKFQAVQAKVILEVDLIVGFNGIPHLQNRSRMPYTEAFLSELMRHGTLAPLGIVHRATEETQLCGYHIPKDSIIQSNLLAVHYDPDYWKNPDEFRPERFLDASGQILLKHEYFLPFSYGGRHCLGENLARDELFLFLTGILANYWIYPDPKSSDPSIVPRVGVGSMPEPHLILFKSRISKN